MATTNFVNGTVVVAEWLNDVDAHVYNQEVDAHAASNLSFSPVGTIAATDVQTAVAEVATDAAAALAAGLAAVTATTVPVTPTGTIAATNVQAAIAELDGDVVAASAAAANALIHDQATVATTSGTAVDITGIPVGIKRLIVKFVGVSTNGTSDKIIQLGTSGGVQATGYIGNTAFNITTTSDVVNHSTGVSAASVVAADTLSGAIQFDLHDTDTWIYRGDLGFVTRGAACWIGGHKVLGGALDRIRLTTVGGTDAFDAGAISLSWEF